MQHNNYSLPPTPYPLRARAGPYYFYRLLFPTLHPCRIIGFRPPTTTIPYAPPCMHAGANLYPELQLPPCWQMNPTIRHYHRIALF